MKYSIVIPCYNEERSIGRVIESLPRDIDEVIVVDNDSNDSTAKVARTYGAKVITEKKRGYGAAIKTGFKHATGEIILTLDGDGQYPTEKVLEMISFLKSKNLDFVSASRFPIERRVMSATRIFGNIMLTKIANVLFGLQLKDSQSGMWIFKRTVLATFDLKSDDMPISEEIKIRAATNRTLTFAEYHIPYHERVGISKLSPLRHGIKNLFFLFRLKYEQLTS